MKYNLNDELDIDDSPIDNINYFAFAASYESSQESSEYATLDLHDSSEGEFENEDNIQDAYTNLFGQFSKLTKQNKKAFKKLNEIELLKEILNC